MTQQPGSEATGIVAETSVSMVQELKLNENATGAQQSEAAGATSTVQEIDAAVVEEHDLMDVTDVHNERSSVRGKPLPPSVRAAKARWSEIFRRVREDDRTPSNLLNLRNVDFRFLDLRHVDLSECDLTNCTFNFAQLDGASLRNSRLRHARLGDATGLVTSALGGADVSGATLPASVERFEMLGTLSDACKSCRMSLLALLSACAYTILTIGTTTDAQLAIVSGSVPLPLLASSVPIRSFMLVAPLVLALMFCYFHLQLVRLWEGCAKMPAVLPNGHTIDQAVQLWLTVGLIRSEEPLLRGRRQRFGALQRWLAMFLGYGVAPATLYFVWARSSVLHTRWLSVVQVVAFASCLGAAWVFRSAMRHTLAAKAQQYNRRRFDALVICAVAMLVPATLMWLERPWLGYAPNLTDFRGAKMDGANIAGVVAQGADFTGAQLRHANMDSSNLHLAKMRSAWLNDATLREANLTRADLRETHLRQSNLLAAKLTRAQAMGSDFAGAYLHSADLTSVDLTNARLCNAVFGTANLRNARLAGANVSGANLANVRGLTSDQLLEACGDENTLLPANMGVSSCSSADTCDTAQE